uniref:Uncharacterized protein n=1 Tax=Anopheles epiroticus TaxID=199890 RepID=A0A182PAM5_9DIPT
MTEPTPADKSLRFSSIDEAFTENNTSDSLIEMNALEQKEPAGKDVAEMRSLEALDTENLEDGTGSVTEVDGRRKSRSSQTQSYDIHKGIAESAMDISLLTANANQLRLLLSYNEKSDTFVACIALVISSLVLQVAVASGVIIIKSYPRSKPNPRIHKLKICTSILVSVITVINILVASLLASVHYNLNSNHYRWSVHSTPRSCSVKMTSTTIYRTKSADSANPNRDHQVEEGGPISNGTSRTLTEELTYDSAGSEYYLALSYNGYDFFRCVVEIALSVSFLAANSNLLRLLVSFKETETFIATEVLVTISIVLQVLVAITVVTITQMNDPSRYAKMKACAVTGAILIALVNLLIPFMINVEHSRIDFGEIYRSFADKPGQQPEPSRRSPTRYDKPHQHVEHAGNRGVRIFTGSEKQSKVFCNPVIFNQDATRVQPYQENDWDNNETTPNYVADRTVNGSDRDRDSGRYDVRRSVLENALNVAFLAANANQLRLLRSANSERADMISYQTIFALLIVSLILQILNCVAMLMMSTYTSQRWPLLRTLACIVATVIALLNLGVVTLLNVLLET